MKTESLEGSLERRGVEAANCSQVHDLGAGGLTGLIPQLQVLGPLQSWEVSVLGTRWVSQINKAR